MSRYAWLGCEDCKVTIGLGKIVISRATGTTYFHNGSAEVRRNSENSILVRAVFKFLGEHLGHRLGAWPEERLDSLIDNDFVEIGGDSDRDVSLEAYVEGFEG